jgi:hypothetical protein
LKAIQRKTNARSGPVGKASGLFLIIPVLFSVILMLSGCQKQSTNVGGNTDSAIQQSTAPDMNMPENWPKGIPDDIPPLPGAIDNIMASGGRIRLFYSSVSRTDIVAYVSKLEQNGFTSQYEIYVQDQPGITPSAQNDQQFDGVSLKKGTYSLRIAVAGNGGATYDLDGLSAEAIKNNLPWPESWASIVPRPEGLNYSESRDIEYSSDALKTVGTFNNPGFTDALQAEHKKVVDNYCARLVLMGYRKVEPPESYQINRTVAVAQLFTDGKWVIAVWGGDNSNKVMVEAWKYPEQEKPEWPKSIPDWVPVFRYGELNSVLEGGSTINLSFKNARLEDIEKYRDSLSQAGFSVIPDYAGSNVGDRIYMMKDNVSVYVSLVQAEVKLSLEIK